MVRSTVWFLAFCLSSLLSVGLIGCRNSEAESQKLAASHAIRLAEVATEDVAEVRRGLPEGATHLVELYSRGQGDDTDPQVIQSEINRARAKVQDLRVAKGTFFAMVSTSGKVLRTDQEQDRMAGSDAFKSYPDLKRALEQSKYVETAGTMEAASGVRGQPDAQWVAAAPVVVDSKPVALYVTGWSWSAYAYRLENSIRGEIKGTLKSDGYETMPLLYVFVVTDREVYGAPISPRVNAEAIRKLDPLKKAKVGTPFSTSLEITGRQFALGVARVPALGTEVGVAVLRSET